MKLFDFDAYSSVTRFLDPDGVVTFIDVGAHSGAMVHRAIHEFPKARVFAFEPSPGPRAELSHQFANDSRITIEPKACGSSNGVATLNITKNTQCSSLLRPTPLGTHLYGAAYDVVEQVKVQKVTLDSWTNQRGISQIDFLKIDAQGHDLEVLRGSTGLLEAGAVKAVNVEAMFVAEYEGCATFGEIDAFLLSRGYGLHQIHEIVSRGTEQQTTYCDALWVRKDILANLHSLVRPRELGLGAKLNALVKKFKNRNPSTYAFYGAGEHTRRLLKLVNDPSERPIAIVDDGAKLWGTFVEGVPVVSPSQLHELGVCNLVLSSDAYEPQLWERSKVLRDQGINVEPMYRQYVA